MSQNQSILKWFFIFLGLLFIGAAGYLFFLSMNPNWNFANLAEKPSNIKSNNPYSLTAQTPVVEPKSVNPPNEVKVQTNFSSASLKNPFIRPVISNTRLKAGRHLQYQGIIQTEKISYGLLKEVVSNKTYMVQEGEFIPELELEVKKITSTTLIYHKNGSELVISLGGIKK